MRIIKFIILFVLLSLFSLLAHSTGRFGINAYQAGQVVCNVNNQYKSTFVFNSNRKIWIESTADGQRFEWQQAMRDEWSIYLDDRSRGFVMQLDLHTTKVTYGTGGNRQQYNLCNIVSARMTKPVPPPNPNPIPRPAPLDDGSQYDISEMTLAGMSRSKTNQLVIWAIAESLRQEQPMCWKKSIPNTVGKPLSSCPAGKRKEGLLCYENCKSGYRSDGAMLCYKKCPKGTKTSPGFCHFKFGSIGGCPAPLTGLKPACMNTNSYSRGVGTPMVCARGQVQKGALCYPQCPGGYAHGGPVCWQRCSGAHPVDCGAGCAQSTGQCVSEVANMVLATGELVANIAGLALTGGTANAGIKTAKTAARTGQKVAAKIALKKALQSARGAVRDKLTARLGSRVFAYVGKKSGRRAGDKLVRDYSKMVLEKAAQKILISQVSQDPSLTEIASMIDPTGVVDVFNAYNKEICETLPMPR